jgi:hypothetical protein
MLTEDQLLADLQATFPGLNAQPLRTFGPLKTIHKDPQNARGAWFKFQDDVGPFMPDGLPIALIPGPGVEPDENGYSSFIHDGFVAWLESRGWYIEMYDYGHYMIVSIEDTLGALDAVAKAWGEPA